MTVRSTHAKAVHYTGAVCGTNDGPATRLSDHRQEITCDDCLSWMDIEALPNDALQGDPRVIELLREVVHGAFRKIDNVPVDATTAAAILTVYDAVKPATRAKLAAMRIDHMADVAWRLLRPNL